MQETELLEALRRLGELCESKTEVVLAGGAAMILAGYVDRNTGDSDAVFSSPKLSHLKRQIKEVAEEMGLSDDWLNDGVKAHRDLLPRDSQTRLVELGVFGSLTVKMLGREDLLLMKMAALRPRDMSDIRAMNPTTAELAFIEEQLERISAFDSKAALRIKLFLEAS